MLPPLELPIREVTHEEAMARFRALYVQERLPTKKVHARWWMSEVACGALTLRSKTRCTMKGTIVMPEWRGFGYAEPLLWRRIQVAQEMGFQVIDVYSRHPGWYYRHGFRLVRERAADHYLECDLDTLTVPPEFRSPNP